MFRKILFGAMFLVAVAATPAAAQYIDTNVNPGEVAPGGEVTVSGTACAPNEEVLIYLVPGDVTAQYAQKAVPAPQGGTLIATIQADENGAFTYTFTIPADAAPGVYTVVTTCGDQTDAETVNVAGVDVTQPTTPGSTTPTGSGGGTGGTGSGNLPRTGSNLNGIGLVGAGLLAVGGGVLLAARKRTGSSPAAA